MAKLSRFTRQASAEPRAAAKRSRHSSLESTPTPTPLGLPIAHRTLLLRPGSMHVCCRSLIRCCRFDPGSAPSSDPGLPCPVGACCWHGVSGPAGANPDGFPALSQYVVSAPGPAPAPVKSPAVGFAPQSSPPLPGSRTCQCHRTHTFHRCGCYRIGIARILM